MEKLSIKFDVSGNDPGLLLTVKMNAAVVAEYQSPDPATVVFEVDEVDGDHVLEFVLSGKTPDQTQVDADGTIVSDNVITISNLSVDDIEINQLVYTHAEYCHDFNGTQAPIQDQFYGTMGCNGTVSIKFTCPFYIWLLEHM